MRIFFNGLNELRALAAFAVIVHHLELFKHREGVASLFEGTLQPLAAGLGKNGVYLFFVLSGFLITYLLMTEMAQQGVIRKKFFYIRRILRIWPLYYLIVILSFVLLPVLVLTWPGFFGDNFYTERISHIHEHYVPNLLAFLLFLPNLALVLFGPVAGAAQSWSVGVEEQFYLLWPLLLNLFKKHILKLLIAIALLKPVLLFGVEWINNRFSISFFQIAYGFLDSFKIELMALGGIGAWLLINGYFTQLFQRVHKIYIWLLVVLIAALLYYGVNYYVLGILYGLLVIFNSAAETNIISGQLLSWLGDRSYGLYMYHPIMMFFSWCISTRWISTDNTLVFNLVYYSIALTLTIIVSHLSFRYVEQYFLRKKNKFAIVQSGKHG